MTFSAFLQSNFQWQSITLFGVAIFGMGFGIWCMGMISMVKNPIIEKYDNYLKEGHYIMMIDTPKERAEELTRHVIHHVGTGVAEKTMH